MNTQILSLLLPILFIIHNIEEYRHFSEFRTFYLKKVNEKLRHKKVFLFALLFLSFVVSGICISNFYIKNSSIQLATTIVTLSLFLNAIQHCLSSLRVRKILPGTVSTALLLIPYTVSYFLFLEKEISFNTLDFIQWVILSGGVMIFSIYISLWVGYCLWKLAQAIKNKIHSIARH